MKRKAIAAAAVLALTGALAVDPAVAQSEDFVGENCMAQEALQQYLGRAFSEGRIASAWSESGNRIELFAAGSGTWTLVEFNPDGGGCLRAHGTGLRIERVNLPLRPDFGS